MTGTFAVVAGGGTAGHLHPGIAVAQALIDLGKQRESIHFLSSDRAIDSKLITAANFDFTQLQGEGIQRNSAFSVLKTLGLLFKSTISACVFIRRFKPKVILSLGGYASLPGSIAGLITRTPVVLHEQNVTPGRANKLISKWAKKSAVSYSETELPRSVLTGNPVRKEIASLQTCERQMHREGLGIPDGNKMVLVTGGSLGSLKINTSIIAALDILDIDVGLTIYHVVGSRDWEEMELPAGHEKIDYRAVEYEDRMPMVLNSADLVISRSGGSITAEISVVGVPSILVPLPGAPGDHQTKNAESLVREQVAILLPDGECSGERIAKEIASIISGEKKLHGVSGNSSGTRNKRAAETIAALMIEESK